MPFSAMADFGALRGASGVMCLCILSRLLPTSTVTADQQCLISGNSQSSDKIRTAMGQAQPAAAILTGLVNSSMLCCGLFTITD